MSDKKYKKREGPGDSGSQSQVPPETENNDSTPKTENKAHAALMKDPIWHMQHQARQRQVHAAWRRLLQVGEGWVCGPQRRQEFSGQNRLSGVLQPRHHVRKGQVWADQWASPSGQTKKIENNSK